MTLASSGTITAAQIALEVGSPFTIPGAATRLLTGRATGTITAPTDFYGQTGGGLCMELSTHTQAIAGSGSIAGVSLGAQAWNRRVFFCVNWACITSDVETSLVSCNLNGVGGGVVHVSNGEGGTSAFSNYGCAICSVPADLSDGTSGSIGLGFSNGTSRTVLITGYRVTGLVSTSAYHNANGFDEPGAAGASSATANLNIPSFGLGFYCAVGSSAAGVGAMSTTGITERQENVINPDGRCSSGFQSGLSTQVSRAITTSTTFVGTGGRLRISASSFQMH